VFLDQESNLSYTSKKEQAELLQKVRCCACHEGLRSDIQGFSFLSGIAVAA